VLQQLGHPGEHRAGIEQQRLLQRGRVQRWIVGIFVRIVLGILVRVVLVGVILGVLVGVVLLRVVLGILVRVVLGVLVGIVLGVLVGIVLGRQRRGVFVSARPLRHHGRFGHP
jgi:hypothetical protein